MRKLLITGGVGFLGYHLCKRLSDKFDEIIIVDIDDFNEEEYADNVSYFQVDMRDKEGIDDLVSRERPDFVIHTAAALPLNKPKVILEVNVGGTKNILESSLKNNVKRFVFISSTAVYGVPEKHPLYENDPVVGVGPYGSAKIMGEKLCREFREKGLCVSIIRPKTFIGTGRLGVFLILYDWVESGKRIPIIGNGKNKYQLLEVEDLVDAIYLMIVKEKSKVNDVFNIGAKEFDTIENDVGKLCSAANNGARVFRTPPKIVKFFLKIFEKFNVSPLYEWVYGTADTDSFISIEKIEKLGWKPLYSNSEALIKSYNWYLDNKLESDAKGTGVTHRVAWSQGVLGLIKKVM